MDLESRSLAWWVSNLQFMSRNTWLWISRETRTLHPDTQCHAVDDGNDLSQEEQDRRECDLERNGLTCLFCKDQLEDILSNLKAQTEEPDQQLVYIALNNYWINDAFIDLESV